MTEQTEHFMYTRKFHQFKKAIEQDTVDYAFWRWQVKINRACFRGYFSRRERDELNELVDRRMAETRAQSLAGVHGAI